MILPVVLLGRVGWIRRWDLWRGKYSTEEGKGAWAYFLLPLLPALRMTCLFLLPCLPCLVLYLPSPMDFLPLKMWEPFLLAFCWLGCFYHSHRKAVKTLWQHRCYIVSIGEPRMLHCIHWGGPTDGYIVSIGGEHGWLPCIRKCKFARPWSHRWPWLNSVNYKPIRTIMNLKGLWGGRGWAETVGGGWEWSAHTVYACETV